jgi:hypothetical protein
MHRRTILRLVFAALILALKGPVANLWDHWDTSPGLFGDTEFQVAALAVIGALGAVVALLATAFDSRSPFHPRTLKLIRARPYPHLHHGPTNQARLHLD